MLHLLQYLCEYESSSTGVVARELIDEKGDRKRLYLHLPKTKIKKGVCPLSLIVFAHSLKTRQTYKLMLRMDIMEYIPSRK